MLAAPHRTSGVPPTPRQDSSGSSGSYHTAPGSPESGRRRGDWTRGTPGARGGGPETQPRLSISAQNSHRGRPGSDFGPRPGPRPPRVRTLPSGEMEVIFSPGPLGGPPAGRAARYLDVQSPGPDLTSSGSSPAPSEGSGDDDGDDEGPGRSAAYLDLRESPPAPSLEPRFECVEVALEDEAPSRTVPKRQIELRAKPRAPGPAGGRGPLLRTGSLDESLSRLQAASCLVQTALARRLQAERTPAAGERPPCAPGGTPEEDPRRRGTAPAKPEQPRGLDACKAPKPWPGLRERAIRRDRPPPGSEPPGPVSSSVFLLAKGAPSEPRRWEPGGTPESGDGPRLGPPPRPRDVRKLLKNTYALSFQPPPAAPREEPEAPPPEVGPPPPPPRFTSTLVKDFLPVVPHPWDGPGPPPSGDSSSSGPSSPDGSSPGRPPPKVYGDGDPPRRKAENITAKPYARSEIRLPGAFPPARPGDPRPGDPPRARHAEEPGPPGRSPEESWGPPEDGSSTSHLPVAEQEASTPFPNEARGPSATPSPGPPEGQPRARVSEQRSYLALPRRPPPPRAAVQPALPSGPPEGGPPESARPAAPRPRAASAPPPVRPGDLPGQARGPLGLPPTPPGKVLLDPESGRYYYVESPQQPRVKLLFDPESGQYLEVLLPSPPPPSPPRARLYPPAAAYPAPLAVGPAFYGVPYAQCPTLSLPPSPGTLPPRSTDLFAPPVPAAKLPWGLPGLEALYYLPTGSPAPSPPGGLTPTLANKGSPFRV
ncbi:LOW QUALITY PROTEIN: proline-rich basic protein 1 [Tachyglossus aculeatus]|uniref:LOW QUALITY PROTEIN: proline-rich basic protein 1 n=1 Tax=Tachyglossus aculeatus TaxID=9261 RepID=UPI0018F4D251|nr:LOW QUALITY PROTEIN: proline-rich basic protein 1 [Tachyglossus aculeatus]